MTRQRGAQCRRREAGREPRAPLPNGSDWKWSHALCARCSAKSVTTWFLAGMWGLEVGRALPTPCWCWEMVAAGARRKADELWEGSGGLVCPGTQTQVQHWFNRCHLSSSLDHTLLRRLVCVCVQIHFSFFFFYLYWLFCWLFCFITGLVLYTCL